VGAGAANFGGLVGAFHGLSSWVSARSLAARRVARAADFSRLRETRYYTKNALSSQ
jgi:hypothetical protein